MPTIVGGWWATKKRGRDDETIERDRREAIARRKKRLNRRVSKTKRSSNESSVAAQTKRGEKLKHESSSWVKSPCGTRQLRKHRLREPISPQRELFPNKTKKRKVVHAKSRIFRETESRNRDYNRVLCEQCGSKTTNPRVEKRPKASQSLGPPSVTVRVPRHRSTRAHKQSRAVVTPDQGCEEIHSYSTPKTEAYRTKRREPTAKVLSFGDEEISSSAFAKTRFPISNDRKRGHHHSLARKYSRPSKSKQRKRRREAVAMNLLGPVPDFARSAKYLYETIRRPKQVLKLDSNVTTGGLIVKGRKSNAAAGNLSSTAVVKHSTWPEPNNPSAHSFVKTPKNRSEVKFELVRNLLLGENAVNNKHNSVLDSSEKKIPSPPAEEVFSSTSVRNATGSCEADFSAKKMNIHRNALVQTSKIESQWECRKQAKDVTKREDNPHKQSRSHELKQLRTQQDDASPIPQYKPMEQTVLNPKTAENGTKGFIEKQNEFALKRSTLAEKNTDTNISSHPKQNIANHQSGIFTQQETNGENFSPSQTPSTSSSAVLSLPMNYNLCGSSQPSFENSGSGNRNSHEDTIVLQTNATIPDKLDESAENTRKEKEDPLRDIGFWQRIVEQEETRTTNSIGRKSFKHTIASLILAKNSSTGDSSVNRGNGGFLWLPSILEGGLDHTGLLE